MPKLSRPALCIYFQGYSFLRTSKNYEMTVTHTVKHKFVVIKNKDEICLLDVNEQKIPHTMEIS
jgi:membrane protease subunit (stomatin/prohibitin family)